MIETYVDANPDLKTLEDIANLFSEIQSLVREIKEVEYKAMNRSVMEGQRVEEQRRLEADARAQIKGLEDKIGKYKGIARGFGLNRFKQQVKIQEGLYIVPSEYFA